MHSASGNARLPMKARGSMNLNTATRPPQPHCEQQRQKPNETQDPINSNTVARQSQSQCNRQRQKLNDSTELEKLEYRRALTATAMQAATPEISERTESLTRIRLRARPASRIKRRRHRFALSRLVLLCFALHCFASRGLLCFAFPSLVLLLLIVFYPAAGRGSSRSCLTSVAMPCLAFVLVAHCVSPHLDLLRFVLLLCVFSSFIQLDLASLFHYAFCCIALRRFALFCLVALQKPDENEDPKHTPVEVRAHCKDNASGNARREMKAHGQINSNTVARPALPQCKRQCL